jgi:hypothetical protein
LNPRPEGEPQPGSASRPFIMHANDLNRTHPKQPSRQHLHE